MDAKDLESANADRDLQARRARHELAGVIFEQVRALAAHQRSVLVASRCGGDLALRSEVEALLDEHDRATGFLAHPPLSSSVGDSVTTSSLAPPTKIGAYRVVSLLGHGGMGAVYLAEQENPARQVALKLLLPGVSSPELIARFGREAQVLGRLQHPCIAQIFEAGLADAGVGPQPYFAMELVRGAPLATAANSRRLGLRERVQLMSRIIRAVHYAHEHGVIHRDLKPANILLDETGTPKVVDFGVARTTDVGHASATRAGEVVGTLGYMSPEQLAGSSDTLDARSDVYALGVIAYELLSGRTPLGLEDLPLPAAAALIRERDPLRLGAIDAQLRGDLETIVTKALEKDRERRYASALEFAEDLERYLRDEPIRARSPSSLYHIGKFTRRHRALVGGVVASFVILAGGIVSTSVKAADLRDERNRAVKLGEEKTREATRAIEANAEAQREARRRESSFNFLANILGSALPEELGRDVKVVDVLDLASCTIGEQYGTEPDIEAVLRSAIGAAFLNLGEWTKAEPELRQALELSREHIGPCELNTMRTAQDLGMVLFRLDRLDEAEPLIVEVLEFDLSTQGERHPETLAAEGNLCALLVQQGRFDEARPRFERLLEVHKSLGDEQRDQALNIADHLGQLLLQQHEYDAAGSLLTWAIDECAAHPSQDPSLREGLWSTLGGVRIYQKRYSEAAVLFEKVLERHRELYGVDDPRTLATTNNLAFALGKSGERERAATLLEDALVDVRRKLGDAHRISVTTLLSLTDLRRRQGEQAKTETLLTELTEILLRDSIEESNDVVYARFNTVTLCILLKRWEKAEPLARKNLDIARRILPPNDWRVAQYASLHGYILFKQGMTDVAEPLLSEGVEGLRAMLDIADERTQRALRYLIEFCEGNGQLERAASLRPLLESQ